MVKISSEWFAACAGFVGLFFLGQATWADSAEADRYVRLLNSDLRFNWIPPKYPPGEGVDKRTLVYFRVHMDGSISDLKVRTSSGSPEYDKAAYDAVLQTVPVLPLPVLQRRPGKDKEPFDVEFTFDYKTFSSALPETNGRKIPRRVDSLTAATAARQAAEASALMKAGKIDEAQELILKACKLDELNRNARLLASKLCLVQAQSTAEPGLKAALLRQALIRDPAYGRARAALYELLEKSGKNPISIGARLDLANQLLSEGKADESQVELKEALRIDDHNADVLKKLSDVRNAQNAEHEIEKWKSVVAATGSAEAHAGLAKAYENQGNRQLAIAEYEQALEKAPNDAFAVAGLKRLRESGAKEELKLPAKTQTE